MERIQVTVNGRPRVAASVSPHTRLLDWLRGEGLTGAKEGCAEGECGACAVLVARPDGPGRTRWTALNACLPPVLAFDGQEIITAEGLGTAPGTGTRENLHPVQREMADRGGSQCGYCTPGFVCAMAAEYYRPDRSPAGDGTEAHPSTGTAVTGIEHAADHERGPNGFDLHALSGNLCRCTGYRPIRDAAYALGSPHPTDPLAQRHQRGAPPVQHTVVAADGAQFVRPATLDELLRRLAEEPTARLVAGATDLGVEVNIGHARPALVLAVDRLEELRTLDVGADRIEIGAALTLSEAEHALAGRVPLLGALFPQFASRLIRNAATLGGNLGTGSPIGDAAPVLLALDATVVLASLDGEREVALAEYFTGYRQSVRAPGEVIRAVRLPVPLAPRTGFYKIAKRRFDDISAVAVAVAMRLDGDVVQSVRIGLGGVAATPVRARRTEAVLTGATWDPATAAEAAALLRTEGTPLDDHRASARYRAAMLEQALLKFYAEERPTAALEVAR
ncbi:xanthine dehydrogenase small subunit [Georgenia yuyongxinii]|uniref:2Fe-2S iron-sulfur cluster binding domain-containing protein n=1 Tax=Georgenia yuyongxinii TaxID=2589797 RepID=A0A552WL34_9MICO|nr:FAD binding domain-containing protein [Georgenia yuyongxinii]TRW43490.1 2Fe-2S iron-sulfur cluster binding domain-containing protein [Georgenia yuyongxinii]